MLLPTSLLSFAFLVASAIAAPLDLSPRQAQPSAFAGASAVASLFNDISRLASSSSPASNATMSGNGTEVAYTTCSGTNVSRVTINPCEGGNGTAGSACVFTTGRNYTITLTYTSATDIPTPRAGLASFNGDSAGIAYSGQSFDACGYTPCPIQAGMAMNYTYLFRTLRAPSFDRLQFNATDGISGPSFMCASIPVNFASA